MWCSRGPCMGEPFSRSMLHFPRRRAMSTTAESAEAAPRRVDQLLAHYGESHRNPTNSAIHCVAIPLIMLSLIGLMYAVHPWLAYAFIGASLVYYARLSVV